MTKLLVTGGAGFIGSHLCEGLLARGHQVRVLDNLVYGRRDDLPAGVEFIQGDIRDPATCRRAADGMEGIFHCAAMSRSGPSQDQIDVCTQSNITGTQNMLLAARDAGVQRFIYSGSSTYYGNRAVPHREGVSPDLLNIYGLTKKVGEDYCLLFAKNFGLDCVVLRYFNVYGPRQPETGAYALVLGIFLHRLAEGKALEIHGDGRQRRDFVHVRDVVAANILAYERAGDEGVRGEIFNVGSGESLSVKELADRISSSQVHTAARKGDAAATLADISKIKTRLGWSPEISFADGLKELITLTK
ncbi:MAG TPA: NAD-dependent epimerase/dehydratase family protein [Rhizomicrobium sp.]|jgi:nucleoside-diphosphate-sugar epimerase|nr:NAD-dependent epimerase/dehydratase family protein [Rhizomicrobium sp.]